MLEEEVQGAQLAVWQTPAAVQSHFEIQSRGSHGPEYQRNRQFEGWKRSFLTASRHKDTTNSPNPGPVVALLGKGFHHRLLVVKTSVQF